MNLLLLLTYYKPEVTAAAHLTNDLIEAYEKNEFNVKIYTPYPSRGITKEEARVYLEKEQTSKCVEVKRFRMFSENKNVLQRMIRYVCCTIVKMFIGLKERNIDVYYASSTPPINGLIMALLKKFKKYKIVYNLQDIFPDSLVHTGMTKKGSIIWKIGRWVENVTYKSADKIIVISEDFKKNIMEKGVPEEKIEIIYNWVDENQIVNIERENNILFDKYNLDKDKFYICYSGNVGKTQNMDMLVEIAKELEENENIQFVVIGDGAYKATLEELIKEKNVINITLLPFQDYADISHVFSLGDAGLIISKKGVGNNSVPSKTWSIMSAERPVLASFDKGSELDKIITENNLGICVDADDKEALKNAILEMHENKDLLPDAGKKGREFILKNLSKEYCTGKHIELLRSI